MEEQSTKVAQFSTKISEELKNKLDEIAKIDGLSQKALLADYVRLRENEKLREAAVGRADEIDNVHSLVVQFETAYNNSIKMNLNQKNVIRTEFAAQLDELNNENVALRDALKETKAKLDDLTEKEKLAVTLQAANIALSDQISVLKQRIEELSDAETATKNVMSERDSAVADMIAAKEKITTLKEEMAQAKIDYNNLEKEYEVLNNSIENVKEKYEKISAERDAVREENVTLREQLAAANAALTEIRSAQQVYINAAEAAKKDKASAQRMVDEAEIRIKNLEEKLEKNKTSVKPTEHKSSESTNLLGHNASTADQIYALHGFK